MDAEVLLAGELLVACIALEDLLACVSAFVDDQSSVGRQLCTTQVAQMLSRWTRELMLTLHVLSQQPLIDEFLRTELARVSSARVALY